MVEGREVADEVPDVRPDAEVAPLADVDRDASWVSRRRHDSTSDRLPPKGRVGPVARDQRSGRSDGQAQERRAPPARPAAAPQSRGQPGEPGASAAPGRTRGPRCLR